jgi:hypothetical protein
MKKIIPVLLLLMAPALCFSSSAGVTSVFDIGTSVRAQSLGGAFTAVPDDAAAVYYNPGALNTLTKFQVQTAYMPLFYDTTYDYAAAALPTVDIGSFGASIAMINTGSIFLRDENGIILSETNQSLMEIIGAWSKELPIESLSAGLSIKLDYNDLANYADNLSFGMDFGMYYKAISETSQELNTGFIIKNIIEPDIKLSATSDKLPRQLIVGLYYRRPLTEAINAGIMADIVTPFGSPFDIKAGAELGFFNTVDIRAGFSTQGIMSMGAGIKLFGDFRVDYGIFFTDLGTQNRFSLTADFGENVPDMRARKAELEEARIERKAKEIGAKELAQLRTQIDQLAGKVKEKERFKAVHYTRGLEAYFDGDLKGALLEFNTVYDMDKEYMSVVYYRGFVAGLIASKKQSNYSDEIVALYRDGVNKYLAQDYKGAKESWEKILKIDPYNRLAIENLKEVNPLIRDVDNMKETK